jgi:hypothetical protein
MKWAISIDIEKDHKIHSVILTLDNRLMAQILGDALRTFHCSPLSNQYPRIHHVSQPMELAE